MGRPKKYRTRLKVILLLILIGIVGVGAYGYSIYHNLQKTAKGVHAPIDRSPVVERSSKLDMKKKAPSSVLMLGIDERKGTGVAQIR